jgi:hypothetical protein
VTDRRKDGQIADNSFLFPRENALKREEKITNSYEIQEIQGEIILQLGFVGKFQVNSLTTRNFLTH